MRTSSPKILYKIYKHLKLTKISLLYIRFSKSLTTNSQNPLQPFFKSFCYRYAWLLKSKRGLLGKFQANVHFYMLSINPFKKFGSSHWRVLLKITHFAFFLGGPISASIPTYHGRGSRDISHMKIFLDKWENFPVNFYELITLQTHHLYSTLKWRGYGCFHVVPTWNTRGVFVGYLLSLFQGIMFHFWPWWNIRFF